MNLIFNFVLIMGSLTLQRITVVIKDLETMIFALNIF